MVKDHIKDNGNLLILLLPSTKARREVKMQLLNLNKKITKLTFAA